MKVQSPWMGRVKGSAGQMTGAKVYDKNVLRAKAFEVNNPKTAAQTTNRNFFTEVSALCADFSEEVLRALFPQKPKTMSRRNAITKQIAAYNEVVGGAKVIDFAAIDTLGNSARLDFGTTIVTNSVSAMTVALDASVKAQTQYADNYFCVALVNEDLGEIAFPVSNVNVATGELAISYPSGWLSSHSIHAIPFIMKQTKGVNASAVSFGSLSVMKSPAAGASVTPPTPTPTPYTDIDIAAVGFAAWDTFSLDLTGTAGEGGTPSKLTNGTTVVASGFAHASGETYTGSFTTNVDSTADTVLEVTMPDTTKVNLDVTFVIQS